MVSSTWPPSPLPPQAYLSPLVYGQKAPWNARQCARLLAGPEKQAPQDVGAEKKNEAVPSPRGAVREAEYYLYQIEETHPRRYYSLKYYTISHNRNS